MDSCECVPSQICHSNQYSSKAARQTLGWKAYCVEWQGLGLGSPQAGLVWKSVVIFAVNNNPCSAGYDASEDIIAWSNVYARREEGSERTFIDFYSPDPSFLSICKSAPRVVGFAS